jgi:hypothetical protein
VSVHGEFQRNLADCVALLREADEPDARSRAAALEQAAREARDDLSAAARRVLGLCGEAAPQRLPERLREQHAERTQHLAAVCRVILGEP